MKRFKQLPEVIINNKVKIDLSQINFNPVAFWFPTRSLYGTDILFWSVKNYNKNCENNDKHISTLLKNIIKIRKPK